MIAHDKEGRDPSKALLTCQYCNQVAGVGPEYEFTDVCPFGISAKVRSW